VALRPDLVVLDVDENTRPAADALDAAGVPLHVTEVRRLDDVVPVLAALADAVGLGGADGTRDRFSANRYRFAGDGLPAFVPIWRRPWMTINSDTYGSSLLAAAGFANVFADAPERYPTVTLEEASARHAAVVLLPSEPYPFAERHRFRSRSALTSPRRRARQPGVRTPSWRAPLSSAVVADEHGPLLRRVALALLCAIGP
jgi:ABC-type Fe3+-hydroxamate transport system substrate-binding protein